MQETIQGSCLRKSEVQETGKTTHDDPGKPEAHPSAQKSGAFEQNERGHHCPPLFTVRLSYEN